MNTVEQIKKAFVGNKDLTQWGVVNAVTQTARDMENPDRQTELEEKASKMAGMEPLYSAVLQNHTGAKSEQ
jgi:hypothetical protein